MRKLAAAMTVFLTLVACSSSSSPPMEENLGQASVALMQVPDDVACVQVTISGARTVTRAFDVSAGEDATFALNQLPIGLDVFSASAFSTACTAVTVTSVPNWVGDSVTVTVAVGVVAHVHLELKRNGMATVGIDFQGDAQNDGGAACDGGCTSACIVTAVRCNGPAVEVCDPPGQWREAACPVACADDFCPSALCIAGDQRCFGLRPDTCPIFGRWLSPDPPCPSGCLAGACVVGVCVPGGRRCDDNLVEFCDAAGQWQASQTCPTRCVNGTCN
jgi:hypothetical protein